MTILEKIIQISAEEKLNLLDEELQEYQKEAERGKVKPFHEIANEEDEKKIFAFVKGWKLKRPKRMSLRESRIERAAVLIFEDYECKSKDEMQKHIEAKAENLMKEMIFAGIQEAEGPQDLEELELCWKIYRETEAINFKSSLFQICEIYWQKVRIYDERGNEIC